MVANVNQSPPRSSRGMFGQILDALFLDLPFIVDSLWRRSEYNADRNHRYDPLATPPISPRPRTWMAEFFLLAVTLVFVVYGPTFRASCSIGGQGFLGVVLIAAALLPVAAIAWLGKQHGFVRRSCSSRLDSRNAGAARRKTLRFTVFVAVVLAAAACAAFAWGLVSFAVSGSGCAEDQSAQWRSLVQLLLVIASIAAAAWFASRDLSPRIWVVTQWALVAGAAGINWFVLATGEAHEVDALPYRHLFAAVAVLVLLLPVVMLLRIRKLFDDVPATWFAQARAVLERTELFVQNRDSDPVLTRQRLLNALINGAIYHPLHLLLLPSLVAIMVEDSQLWVVWVAFAVALLMLTWGSIAARWQQMVDYVSRWFFTGTPLLISLLVIVIAAARLAGVHYVSTLLAAAPFGVIFMWVLLFYVLFWLFEHMNYQALAPEVLRLTGAGSAADAQRGYVPYPAGQDVSGTRVALSDRYLAAQGAGRLAVVGWFPRDGSGRQRAFHTYAYVELFLALAANANIVERDLRNDPRSAELARDLARNLQTGAVDLERRLKLHFNIINIALFAVLTAFVSCIHYRSQPPEPMVVAKVAEAGQFSLADALRKQRDRKQPALVVAASGGGSRAAVFTAATLQALAERNLADDVVLVSGASGGGVALAYYAAHYPSLTAALDVKSCAAWADYQEAVGRPFIENVLAGAMEWRVTAASPLSALLSESFEHWQLFGQKKGPQSTLGDIGAVGLILNTTISGHPLSDSDVIGNVMTGVAGEPPLYSYMRGGRLVFTNLLGTRRIFPTPHQARLADVDFQFVPVTDPKVELPRAAALNANFPPVFPNAGVIVPGAAQPYYVTDGGVVENLGLLSALYALRDAVRELKEKGEPLPDIHLMAIEASAVDIDYSPDRGLGALGNGKERLTGGLTEELIDDIDRIAGQKLTPHYLTMPLALRSRGGLGTHWMLADDIEVRNPHLLQPPGPMDRVWDALTRRHDLSANISKQDLLDLLARLYAPAQPKCGRPAGPSGQRALSVEQWIRGQAPAGVAPDFLLKELQSLPKGG